MPQGILYLVFQLMSNNELKNTLVPPLRFPEFRDTEGWEVRELSEFITERSESPNKKIPLYSLTIEEGVVPKTERYERSFLVKDEEEAYKMIYPNDFAFNPMNLRFGAIARYSGNENVALSKYYNIFHCDNSVDARFCEMYFKSYGMLTHYNDIATGTLIEKRRVHFSNFLQLKINFPKLSEQQKIASCLASLDDLITAESQKLDALKAHKKGLMQQLFPVEGETVPRLRFAEFLDTEGWEEKAISDIAKVTTGNKDTQNKIETGKYPFFVRSQTVERINSYSFDGEAILTSGDGVGVGKNFHYINGKFDFHQRVYCIYDFDKNVLGKFIYMYFSEHFYKRVMQLSAKNSVDSVRMSMITEMPIYIPSLAEQQKIASCLSSLDELIKAENDKLEALKGHKKGLMQQLFPNTNEETI